MLPGHTIRSSAEALAREEPKPLRELDDETFLKRMDRAQAISRPRIIEHFADGLDAVAAEISVDDCLEAIRNRDAEAVASHPAWEELRIELGTVFKASPEARRILEDPKKPLAGLFKLKDSYLAQTYIAAARAAAPLDPSEAEDYLDPRFDPVAWAAGERELAIAQAQPGGARILRFAPLVNPAWQPLAQGELFDFDALRQWALRYVETHGAEAVTNLVGSSQDALREVLRRAWEEPTTQRQFERALLSLEDAGGGVRLGLAKGQQEAFERWIDRQKVPGGPWSDWSAERIQREIDAKYRRALVYRARVIAKTESLQSGNEGQLRTFQEQVTQKVVDSADWVLEWLTRLINVCPRCVAFDASTREIEEGGMFVSDGSGPRGVETISLPEVHVGGYCSFRRMLRSEAQAPRAA